MSQIVTALEDHQFERKLTPHSPILSTLMCASEHAPKFPRKWTKLLARGQKGWDELAHLVAGSGAAFSALLGTTTAVDVVHGGVKVNALPELVTAAVNFRIDFSESVASTEEHVTKLVRKVAKKHGLKFSAFKNATDLGGRFVSVEQFGLPLEPAPRTPDSGGVWDLFAGTVRAVTGENRVVSPFASTGNTDCKMYYNLSRNIFRYSGAPMNGGENMHTVDERSKLTSHWAIVDWLHAMIQNADAYDGEQ